MSSTKIKTYCRFCHAYCPMVATVEDNRLLALEPDTDNPVYGGYARLARLQDAQTARYLLKLLRSNAQLGLYYASFGTSKELEDRVLNHLYWNKYFESQKLPETAEAFAGRLQAGRAEMVRRRCAAL